MFMIFNNPLKLSIFTYLFLVIILIITKCKMFFKTNGMVKKFGCGRDSTYFNLSTVFYSIAVVVSFVFQYLKLSNIH